MRSEEEIREQYEFLAEELADEEMNHEGVRQMFTYYRRAHPRARRDRKSVV